MGVTGYEVRQFNTVADALPRIAKALERIADALDRQEP
jgi:molybdopterin-biosynthesis enzyme MoeA-like protein